MKNKNQSKNIFHDVQISDILIALSAGYLGCHLLRYALHSNSVKSQDRDLKAIIQETIDNREKQKWVRMKLL